MRYRYKRRTDSDIGAYELNNMVKWESERFQVTKILSDHVYKYDAKEHRVVNPMVEA